MNNFIKSVFAGIAIGLAGCIYLAVPTQWVGAILFSIGLMLVFIFNFNLYTGKIGYIKSTKEIPNMLFIILGNAVGAFLVALISPYNAIALITSKLTLWDPALVLAKGIGCGYLIFAAVETKKKFNPPLSAFLFVPTFILCGFEHSIADMFYFFSAWYFSFDAVLFIITVIIGNAIGALLGNYLHSFMEQ